MKLHRTLAASAAALLTCAAHADIIMEQKMEGPQTVTSVTRIKGDKIRTDVGAEMSSILDTKTGDQITLMHPQKAVMKMTGEQMKANIEMAKKMAAQLSGGNAEAQPKIVATGKKEKVGDYDCEIYTYGFGSSTNSLWVARNFPNYAAMKAELEPLKKMFGQTVDMSAIDGIVVKTVTQAAGMKTTTTLTSVKQQPLDASLFTVPSDYK